MKELKLKLGLLLFISGLFFSGCYTQMATRDYDHDRYSSRHQEDYQTEDDTSYSDDSSYTDDGNYDDGTVINNYYGYPGYRRYFWHYYPGVSIDYYYDPFCYDPFYWNYWCLPVYYSYDPFFHFPYYGYYGGYVYYDYGSGYYGDTKYRTRGRSSDIIRLRNGGGRSSFVTRGGNALNRGTLARTIRERDRISSMRERNSDNRNALRNRSSEGRVNRNPAVKRNSNDTRPRVDQGRRYEERKREVRKEPRRRNGNPGSYEPRRRESPRSYSPPQRSYSPPRSYSAPRSSTPRSSAPPARSTPPSRGGDSGRRSSR